MVVWDRFVAHFTEALERALRCSPEERQQLVASESNRREREPDRAA